MQITSLLFGVTADMYCSLPAENWVIINLNDFCDFVCVQENMFQFDCEKEKYALKPMNCPGHW